MNNTQTLPPIHPAQAGPTYEFGKLDLKRKILMVAITALSAYVLTLTLGKSLLAITATVIATPFVMFFVYAMLLPAKKLPPNTPLSPDVLETIKNIQQQKGFDLIKSSLSSNQRMVHVPDVGNSFFASLAFVLKEEMGICETEQSLRDKIYEAAQGEFKDFITLSIHAPLYIYLEKIKSTESNYSIRSYREGFVLANILHFNLSTVSAIYTDPGSLTPNQIKKMNTTQLTEYYNDSTRYKLLSTTYDAPHDEKAPTLVLAEFQGRYMPIIHTKNEL